MIDIEATPANRKVYSPAELAAMKARAAQRTAQPVAKRSPKDAAVDLLSYVTAVVKAEKQATLGSKGKPNTFVQAAQRDMGLVADGVYGPGTRTKGQQLTGKKFPPR